MRTPKPIGTSSDDPETVAQRIADYVARVSQPCSIWILDDAIYVLACSYAFNEAFRTNRRARLLETLSPPTRRQVCVE